MQSNLVIAVIGIGGGLIAAIGRKSWIIRQENIDRRLLVPERWQEIGMVVTGGVLMVIGVSSLAIYLVTR